MRARNLPLITAFSLHGSELRRAATARIASSGLAAELVFHAEKTVQTPQRLDVRDLEALLRHADVLPLAELLHGALHRVDVEAHARREVHGRDRERHRSAPGGGAE